MSKVDNPVGKRLVRRFWGDDRPSHEFGNEHHHIDAVKDGKNGFFTLTTHYYTESGTRKPLHLHYAADNVVSVKVSDAHDDRLILPGGFMEAHPGTMWQAWDVVPFDGPAVYGVSLEEGRRILGG